MCPDKGTSFLQQQIDKLQSVAYNTSGRMIVMMTKKIWNIDMEASQDSKLISEIQPVDIVIRMGCNVNCPYLPCRYRGDWGLEDPSGKEDSAFEETIEQIHHRILDLKQRIQNGIC